MLSMYVDIEHKTWDEILQYVTFVYNTAVQETTEFTPFKLVYGRRVATPLDAILPVDHGAMTDETIEDFIEKAEVARQLARHRIRTQQITDACRYKLGRRNVQYSPGDRMWVWTPILL